MKSFGIKILDDDIALYNFTKEIFNFLTTLKPDYFTNFSEIIDLINQVSSNTYGSSGMVVSSNNIYGVSGGIFSGMGSFYKYSFNFNFKQYLHEENITVSITVSVNLFKKSNKRLIFHF